MGWLVTGAANVKASAEQLAVQKPFGRAAGVGFVEQGLYNHGRLLVAGVAEIRVPMEALQVLVSESARSASVVVEDPHKPSGDRAPGWLGGRQFT